MATNFPPNNGNSDREEMDGQEHSHGSGTTDDRYERTDARNSAVLMVGFVLFAAAVLTALAMVYYVRFGFERAAERADKPITAFTPEEIKKTAFHGPENLQLSPREEMDEYRAISTKTLHTYGWVNKDVNVARIPIDEAMKISLQRGFPTRKPELAAAFVDEGTSSAQDSSAGRTFRNRMR